MHFELDVSHREDRDDGTFDDYAWRTSLGP